MRTKTTPFYPDFLNGMKRSSRSGRNRTDLRTLFETAINKTTARSPFHVDYYMYLLTDFRGDKIHTVFNIGLRGSYVSPTNNYNGEKNNVFIYFLYIVSVKCRGKEGLRCSR